MTKTQIPANLTEAISLIDQPMPGLAEATLAEAAKNYGSTDGLRVKDYYREAQTVNLELGR